MKAKDIMNRRIITVKEEMTVDETARILLENKISGVPVVDDQNQVIGIVSETDLIYREKHLHIPSFISILDGVIFLESTKELEHQVRKMAAYKVRDVMTRKVLTIQEDTELEDIVDIIVEKRINRLPVVDQEGKLVGIVTRSDILRHII
ncbi:CBS domain-containing protein [Geosporobacter subterraneus DSM 17957]|uniref:CBS domain-containing protein n=1 Tax=Geosporobacter subterraneus DSM 17957 TaxID=1121919 RepID=A0A1M6D7D4_9FIRM|nr:CBS domain-containing protein [Geosporobacter subterraneus]SHI69142.1 CBS domain-containing protein [Geosporobacter subterraneus DSM 17957]